MLIAKAFCGGLFEHKHSIHIHKSFSSAHPSLSLSISFLCSAKSLSIYLFHICIFFVSQCSHSICATNKQTTKAKAQETYRHSIASS